MSHTTMLSIDVEKGSCEAIKEYSNSHGSAPVIWGIFCKEYLNQSENYWIHNNGDELWRLYGRTVIPASFRAVLMMTFDKQLITRANFDRAASDIKTFLEAFPVNPEFSNHWPEIAADLMRLKTDNPEVVAVGIHQTSVTENPYKYFDEKTETYKLRDDLFDLYADLDGLESD